jgi:hypothetical protein
VALRLIGGHFQSFLTEIDQLKTVTQGGPTTEN